MATRTLPIIGAERDGRYWRAACVACPQWKGPRRETAGMAYTDGREHQETEHQQGKP